MVDGLPHPLLLRVWNGFWRWSIALTRPSRNSNLRRLRRRGESLGSLVIREATPADAPALARLHVRTWNATYGPMGLRGPTADVRERQWRAAFAREDPLWFCLVVERGDGELVGFAQANRSDNPAYGGELRRVHLLRHYQRLGLGSRLVGRVARRFLAAGIRSMWLSADPRNPSAAAWRALGATRCDEDPRNGDFGWSDITPLARLPE